MQVYVVALGCKLSQSEADSWRRGLARAGCEPVGAPEQAELCIVNTCTVTNTAARRSRQTIRRCTRANPNTSVIVAGCHAELNPSELARLPGVSLVLTMAEKERLVGLATEGLGLPDRDALSAEAPPGRTSSSTASRARTRALVKIQDGCDNACTYCVVRIARGRHRSRPMSDILEEVLLRQAEGHQEVVLTGVNIGAYGQDLGVTLEHLVTSALARTQFPRLRLSSIEPWDLTPELLSLWRNPRLCRHLHLPLQSGCDATLERMNRRYTIRQFSALLSEVRGAIPDVAITTDVIVGFPGEDEREFTESFEYVASLSLARIHVFPYSSRPLTPASTMPGQVTPAAKKQRMLHMTQLAQQSALAFRTRFVGRTMDVLWESGQGNEWNGLTDNYIRVWAESPQSLRNHLQPTRLIRVTERGLIGELCPLDAKPDAHRYCLASPSEQRGSGARPRCQP